ncbi:MAG: hypothetical protein A3F35_00385 [Candidatus Woykebacteria bacterium RIFCSPHIGHO2_12_FULL_45_10]|uniref:Glycosyl transferase family 1 domain-containing protein n=1 Tax=Candidatus Woykebacteria bacterium RIFCSPHIGHO2_12_FULL_45_10 TaxID=1802603 RepID=A0A1G1WQ74_9BACT|nr:MAG: hypothetical protein A3F35_00385 [Candidatus Woykebacteria bacterium RIFCSPHIGHO2_12_FULL_45_10]
MKIFIEGSALFKERTGVVQYTKRLVEATARTYPEHSYTVFGFKFFTRPLPQNPFPKKLGIRFKIVRLVPGRGYNLLFKWGVAPPIDLLLRSCPDIVFFPNFVRWPVISRKTKTLLAVHDLSFVHFGQFTHPKNLPYMLKHVSRSINHASHILTISESSKRQIIEHYKVNPEKISIVTPAIDHAEFFPRTQNEISMIRKKYKLPTKYILYASTLEPRKNVEGILQAYAALDEKLKKTNGLVLTGGKGWKDESILKTIAELKNIGENITQTGYAPDEDLPAIYSGASLFVYPSFYEGFGIPLLEAMACGVPVICSDNSSLPEVVGDAAILIKAESAQAITKAISKVLSDSKLAKSLRQKGFAQAKKFTWEKSATKLLKVFQKLA